MTEHSECLQKTNEKKYEFHIEVHNEESTALDQNPPLELNSHNTSPNPNDDNDDTDYYLDGTPSISPSSYLQVKVCFTISLLSYKVCQIEMHKPITLAYNWLWSTLFYSH